MGEAAVGVLEDVWEQCYSSGWPKGLLVADAWSHPAKFSYNLIQRIYQHARTEGWLPPGAVVVDPFAGVNLGCLEALRLGCAWIGVELENRFFQIGQNNISKWLADYKDLPGFGPWALCINGDSRRLTELLPGMAQACISSPPYAGAGEVLGAHNGIDWSKTTGTGQRLTPGRAMQPYGDTSGQLCQMAVSSPPYGDQQVGTGTAGRTGWRGYTDHGGGGRATAGQLAALAVASPPDADGCTHTWGADPQHVQGGEVRQVAYGDSKNNLGNMQSGEIDLACQQNPDRILCGVHNTLSGGSVWQSVQTAESPYHESRNAANHVATPELVSSSKDDRSRQAMGHTSQPQNSTSLCPTVGGQMLPTGTEAGKSFEDMLGSNNAGQPSHATTINASPVAQPNASRSTTRKTRKKRAAFGTIASTISKPSVCDVTSPTTGILSAPSLASSVDNPHEQEAPKPVVQMPVGENLTGEPASGRTENTTRCTCANNAVFLSNSQEEDTSVVPLPASVFVKMPSPAKDALRESSPSNFWDAAFQVVSQTYALLAPGAHAIFVCKRYVRGGQIVEFSQQWVQCCEAVGFRLVHWHKAMLVEDHGTELDLFGGGETKRQTKRVSFFRRLAEKKGSPAIDWEDVLCFVKPGTDGPAPMLCVSSPPYNATMAQTHNGTHGGTRGSMPSEPGALYRYGSTQGQLEGLPSGPVPTLCVSSPPYAQGLGKNCTYADPHKAHLGNTRAILTEKSIAEPYYGTTVGQLGAMREGRQ